jgi:hypothetical protein
MSYSNYGAGSTAGYFNTLWTFWPSVFTNAIVDYLTNGIIRPMMPGGMIGQHIVSGLDFTAKGVSTAMNNNIFSMFTGGGGSSPSGPATMH